MKEYLDTEGSIYKTTFDAGHSHTVEIDSSGNGKTSQDSGHYHVIEDYSVIVADGHLHHLTGAKSLAESVLSQLNGPIDQNRVYAEASKIAKEQFGMNVNLNRINGIAAKCITQARNTEEAIKLVRQRIEN